MTEATIRRAIDSPWTQLEPIRLGAIPARLGTPDAYVTVMQDGEPRIRVDLYADYGEESFAFEEVRCWRGYIAVGFGNRLYVISTSREAKTIDLGSYFGHLYPIEPCLLVASGTGLFCIDQDGKVHWITENLGIDGVVVNCVEDGVIYGDGEWNPPGDWKPFRIRLDTGISI